VFVDESGFLLIPNVRRTWAPRGLTPCLRHLRGPVDLLWDRGSIHRHREVRAFLADHPRLHVHYFPAYAPELNPAEYVWAQADHELANGVPDDLRELRDCLRDATRRLRRSQALLWSCIYASDLPWAR
jgi:transposase